MMKKLVGRHASIATIFVRAAVDAQEYTDLSVLVAEYVAQMTPEEKERCLIHGAHKKMYRALYSVPRVFLKRFGVTFPAYLAIPRGGCNAFLYTPTARATVQDLRLWFRSQTKRAKEKADIYRKDKAFFDAVMSALPKRVLVTVKWAAALEIREAA